MNKNDQNDARGAFPTITYRAVCDLTAKDRDYVIPLEIAPDDVILSEADWFENEELEIEYARTLRAFVRWRCGRG